MSTRKEKTIYELFRVSILLKAIGSIGEMLAGLLIAVIPQQFVLRSAFFITQGDVDLDTNDFFARGLVSAAHWVAISNTWFIGTYLFFRGFIQLVLVIALFKNKQWAYPALLIVMGILVCTQVYDIYHSHSIPTVMLTIFDLVTMYLIWREYILLKESKKNDLKG